MKHLGWGGGGELGEALLIGCSLIMKIRKRLVHDVMASVTLTALIQFHSIQFSSIQISIEIKFNSIFSST